MKHIKQSKRGSHIVTVSFPEHLGTKCLDEVRAILRPVGSSYLKLLATSSYLATAYPRLKKEKKQCVLLGVLVCSLC